MTAFQYYAEYMRIIEIEDERERKRQMKELNRMMYKFH